MMFKTVALVLAVVAVSDAFRLDNSLPRTVMSGRVHSGVEQRVMEALERVLSGVATDSGEMTQQERRTLEHNVFCGVVDDILREVSQLETPSLAQIERIVVSGFRGLVPRMDSRDATRMVEVALKHIEAHRELFVEVSQVLSRHSVRSVMEVAGRLWSRVEKMNELFERQVRDMISTELQQHVSSQDSERILEALHHCFETRSFFYYFAEQCLRMYQSGAVRVEALPLRDVELSVEDVVATVERLVKGGSVRVSAHELTVALEHIVDLMLQHRVTLTDVEKLIRHVLGEDCTLAEVDAVLRQCLTLVENRLEREVRPHVADSALERLVRKVERGTVTTRDVQRILEQLFGQKSIRVSGNDLEQIALVVQRIVETAVDNRSNDFDGHMKTVENVLRNNNNNNDNNNDNDDDDDIEHVAF